MVIDYKMKLELGMHSREIQRDWYGKRGISLHGFYVIAQVTDSERHIEVLDLWSEDTKQDSWFTQSALDIGFAWMEKVFPNFQVYLFSGKYSLNIHVNTIVPSVINMLSLTFRNIHYIYSIVTIS